MQNAGTAGQFGGTGTRERRTDAPGHDVGARVLAMARAAAALHMAMATPGGVGVCCAPGGRESAGSGAGGLGGAR